MSDEITVIGDRFWSRAYRRSGSRGGFAIALHTVIGPAGIVECDVEHRDVGSSRWTPAASFSPILRPALSSVHVDEPLEEVRYAGRICGRWDQIRFGLLEPQWQT
jgi:hypothetical protein